MLHAPTIVSPRAGETETDLRPIIEVERIEGAEAYLIEVGPEPTFFDLNTLSYVSRHFWPRDLPLAGSIDRLRYAGYAAKLGRYPDRFPEPWRWRVPVNLTAMVCAPHGFRIVPCPDWLRVFASRIVEGHDDPLRALAQFAAFQISNEGSTSGYFTAYEMLARNMGVCGNVAELIAVLATTLGYPSKLLGLVAPDQGHVVATSRRRDGSWVLLDGLYNVVVEGEVRDLIRRVKEEPDFLLDMAFEGVAHPYRYFFTDVSFISQVETTRGGMSFSPEDEVIALDALNFEVGPGAIAEVERQASERLASTFLVRACYYKNEAWSPFGYSYFHSRTPLRPGERYRDNTHDRVPPGYRTAG